MEDGSRPLHAEKLQSSSQPVNVAGPLIARYTSDEVYVQSRLSFPGIAAFSAGDFASFAHFRLFLRDF